MVETTQATQAAPLICIEELQQKLGVSDAVFEGTKAAKRWKSGRQVGEKEFQEACEAFRKAPVGGSVEDKEARG